MPILCFLGQGIQQRPKGLCTGTCSGMATILVVQYGHHKIYSLILDSRHPTALIKQVFQVMDSKTDLNLDLRIKEQQENKCKWETQSLYQCNNTSVSTLSQHRFTGVKKWLGFRTCYIYSFQERKEEQSRYCIQTRVTIL